MRNYGSSYPSTTRDRTCIVNLISMPRRIQLEYFSTNKALFFKWLMVMFRVVMSCMSGASHKFKIRDSVIRLYLIFMMNTLILFQESSNFLFHHKAMFSHIALTGKRMTWNLNKHITKLVDSSASLPIWVILSGKIARSINPMALLRTIVSNVPFYITRSSLKSFTTRIALSFHRQYYTSGRMKRLVI